MSSRLGVIVKIAKPGLLRDLVDRLAAAGCETSQVDECACRVFHKHAVDAAEEWYELHFFLRAWQAHHGVEVSARPDWRGDDKLVRSH
jgi:hypothetical protein